MSKKNEYYKEAFDQTGDRDVSENMALQNNLVDLKGKKAPEISFDGSNYLPGETPQSTNVDSSPAGEPLKGAALAEGFTQGETLNPYEQMMAQGGTSKFFNMDNLNNYMTDAGKKYEKSVNTRTAGLIADAEYGKNAVIDNHNEAYNALNAQNRKNIAALPGQMTKLGLYGSGTGEVALSNIATDYQNQYNELLKQKNKGLMDIDNQIRQLKQNAANDISNYHAQLAAEYPQYYLQMLQNQFAAYDSDRKYLQSMYEYEDSARRSDYQYEDSARRSDYQYEDGARRSDYQFDAQRQDEHNRFYDNFNYGKEMDEKTAKDAYYQQLLPYYLKNNPNGSGEEFRRWADSFFLNNEGGSLTPPGAYAPTSPAGEAMGNAPVITLNDGTVIGEPSQSATQTDSSDTQTTPGFTPVAPTYQSSSSGGSSSGGSSSGGGVVPQKPTKNEKALTTVINNVNNVAIGDSIPQGGGEVSGYLRELVAKELATGDYTEDEAAYIAENIGLTSKDIANAINDIRRNNISNNNSKYSRR